MNDNYVCPICGKTVTISKIHSENEEYEENPIQKVGCPKCNVHVQGAETWEFVIAVKNTMNKVDYLVLHGMNREKLISCVKQKKNLQEVNDYFGSIIRLFWIEFGK